MTGAPQVGPLPPLVPPSPTKLVLDNGLEVIAVRRTVAPIVAVSIMLRTGADTDPPEAIGLAAATADMLDEGAGNRDPLALVEELEQLGADLWLGCGRDGSQVSLQVPRSGLADALSIVGDVLVRPRLTAEDWSRVRGDRLTAVAQRRDEPEAVANVVGDRVLYGDGHPYGRPVDGFVHSVERIGIDDIRRFHSTYVRPNNACLVIAGDFDEAALRD